MTDLSTDTRVFEREDETYFVTINHSAEWGWSYRVETDRRGLVDAGPLKDDHPWITLTKLFPELSRPGDPA